MSKISELVAVEVMGWSVNKERSPYRWSVPLSDPYFREFDGIQAIPSLMPSFDTNITDAWRVVEKMREKGWKFAMEDTHYEGVFVRFRKGNESYTSSTFDGDRFAICLAALRACGVSEDRIEQARENA